MLRWHVRARVVRSRHDLVHENRREFQRHSQNSFSRIKMQFGHTICQEKHLRAKYPNMPAPLSRDLMPFLEHTPQVVDLGFEGVQIQGH